MEKKFNNYSSPLRYPGGKGCLFKFMSAFLEENWEYFDVTIRCYLLSQAISAAIDELEEEGKIQYQEEEE